MSQHTKRTYNSVNRNARAAQTRQRIVVAAKKLFQKEGFEFVTIEKIAQVAEVSAPTIYALFQSKRGILSAIMDEALPTEQFESLVKMSMQEKSARAHLLITAKIARHIYDAERKQMSIFQGASVLAPEFKTLEEEREKRRYQRLRGTIKILEKDNCLLKNQVSKAHDLLWALTGRDLYRMLVVEQKWKSDEYEKWLGQMLINTLIENTNKS